MGRMRRRRVVIVAFEGTQSLDVTGPLEVFNAGNRLGADTEYRVTIGALSGAPIVTSSGLRLLPDSALADITGPIARGLYSFH